MGTSTDIMPQVKYQSPSSIGFTRTHLKIRKFLVDFMTFKVV